MIFLVVTKNFKALHLEVEGITHVNGPLKTLSLARRVPLSNFGKEKLPGDDSESNSTIISNDCSYIVRMAKSTQSRATPFLA